MRWTRWTPSRTSISRVSKSLRAPTAPNTVCRSQVERWTEKPIDTRCSITFWICSSVAPSCMVTIMVDCCQLSLSAVSSKPPRICSLAVRYEERARRSGVYLGLEFRISRSALHFWHELFFLDLAHDVDQPLVDHHQVAVA